MSRGLVPTLLALALSGCLALAAPQGERPAEGAETEGALGAAAALSFGAPVVAIQGCMTCYEPTLAVDDLGRMYATAYNDLVGVSLDGGRTFETRAAPAVLHEGEGLRADPTVVARGDTVWWYAFVAQRVGPVAVGSALQIASSDDGARTWKTNLLLDQDDGIVNVDRPWVGFLDGELLLLYTPPLSSTGLLLRSSDEGATFGPPTPVTLPVEGPFPSPRGPLAVAPDGTIAIPHFADPRAQAGAADTIGAGAVRVALSRDGGRTFLSHEAAPLAAGTLGGYWPMAAFDAAGGLHIGWRESDGAVRVVSSADAGRTWGAPVEWAPAGTSTSKLHPWLEPTEGGGLAVGWFESAAAGRYDLKVALAPGDAVTALANIDAERCTDFPALASLPDGRLGAVGTNCFGRTFAAFSEPSGSE